MINKSKVAMKLAAAMPNIFTNSDMFEDYYQLVHVRQQPKPSGPQNYIGLEIECFSHNNKYKILELVLAHDLENHVNVYDDGSIEPPYDYHTCELRILGTEQEMPMLLKKLGKFFKEGKFQVNWSCGLHVHLDMRNRDVEKCYNKLLKVQDVLFGMVKKDRWDSEYCQWSSLKHRDERFNAINYTAYGKHKTLEVRLHHGSLDVVKIGNWISLLLRAIKGKTLISVESKKDILKWLGPDKKLKGYINKGFRKNWFVKKADIVKNAHQDNDSDSEDHVWEP